MKKTMTKVLAAVLMTAGLAGGAVANSYNAGTLNPTPVSGVNTVGVGSFTDWLNFSVSNPYNAVFGVVNDMNASWGSWVIYDVTGLDVWLCAGTNGSGGCGIYVGNGDNVTGAGPLPAGNYSLRLTGTGAGSQGGMYSYLAFANAVPEPGEWALMLSGLGLLGAMVRRKRAGRGAQ